MLSLNANLSMASQALEADTGALTITNNNIANVNTPGYSRQLVNLSSVALAGTGLNQDGGVSFNGFTVVRDQLLQIGINQKTSDSSSLTTQSVSWAQIESAFSSTSTGLGQAVSQLFSTLSSLATAPQDAATRQTAYSAASQLVDAFHQAAGSLSSVQADANTSVSGIVANINQATTQIASLNGQLAALQAAGQPSGTIQNQVDQLTSQLSQLTGISLTNTDSTPTVSTSGGSPLVAGTTAYALQVTQTPDGKNHVLDTQGKDITGNLLSGSLGGTITMRDQSVPQLSTSLDQFASQLATAMNGAQAQGYDQNGNVGQAMFTLPTAGISAAAGISVALSTGSSIAVSSDGSTGSSSNLKNLLAVQTTALPSGQTPSNTYAGFVQQIGASSGAVTSGLNATNAALTQLKTQQSSESGVSIDEETTNLLRYQQAYSAAAQVINTMNNLFSIVLNMSR